MAGFAELARRRVPELMDDPALDARQHDAALRGLARLNAVSGSARIVYRALQRIARQRGVRSLRVLDVASGAGDVPISLLRRAARSGLQIQMHACDISPIAVRHGAALAAQAGVSIDFFVANVVREAIAGTYDVITCSLFLHHLDADDAATVLRNMTAAAQVVLINDLRRSVAGLGLAYAATRLLTRSPIVHVDGPRSVCAAYTLEEVRALAERAGMLAARVERRWPARWLLSWSKP